MYRKMNKQELKRSRGAKLATAAAALLLSLTITGCSLLPIEEETLQPPLIQPTEEELDIVEAAIGDIQSFMRGTAHFVSASTETLSFKESGGRLKSLGVAVGQEVKAGELLVELETGDLDLQLKLQRLNVERVRLQYNQARASGAGDTDLRLRQIDLEREQLTLNAMESRLNNSRLLAPISGLVTFVETLSSGDTVNAHQAIVTIADPAQMQLTYVASNTNEVFPVETGMPVKLRYKGVNYDGTVLQTPANAPLTSDVNRSERNSVTIIIGMDQQPDDVQIGHSAELTIELQNRENVIVLPRSAIRTYVGRNYVQILEDERRKEVDVEIGLTTATQVEIVRGLEEGQQVILNN